MQEGLDGVNSVTREYLGGIRVVKAFGQEKREVRRFAEANGELTSASTFALRVMALFGPAISLFMNLGIVAVLWIGGFRVAGSSLQVGKIIAFINYMTQILFSLNMISAIISSFVRAKASWDRVGAILKAQGSEKSRAMCPAAVGADTARAGAASPCDSTASFSRTRRPTAGSCWRAWTSPARRASSPPSSGRPAPGKSSLASLVPRFYEPTGERSSLADWTSASWIFGTCAGASRWCRRRRSSSRAPSRRTSAGGRDDATDAELAEAARLARAHNFIAGFPEGYRTVLGQGGVNLSGGQKQRLAIARALVRRPDVLILDDCTSSVDSITEAEILGGIRGLRRRLHLHPHHAAHFGGRRR